MILDLESVFNTEGLVKDFDFELDLSQEELSGVKPFTTPVRVSGSVGNHTGVVELNAVAETAAPSPSPSRFRSRYSTHLSLI